MEWFRKPVESVKSNAMLSEKTNMPCQALSCSRYSRYLIVPPSQVYFGTFHARIYLSAAMVGVNCATGMSALMRKDLLDKAGGFQAFGCYLAEDFFFAKYITVSQELSMLLLLFHCQGPRHFLVTIKIFSL